MKCNNSVLIHWCGWVKEYSALLREGSTAASAVACVQFKKSLNCTWRPSGITAFHCTESYSLTNEEVTLGFSQNCNKQMQWVLTNCFLSLRFNSLNLIHLKSKWFILKNKHLILLLEKHPIILPSQHKMS